MSELDRQFHKQARRNSMPKDSRFTVRVRETSPKKWREALSWEEAGEELLDYKHGDIEEYPDAR